MHGRISVAKALKKIECVSAAGVDKKLIEGSGREALIVLIRRYLSTRYRGRDFEQFVETICHSGLTLIIPRIRRITPGNPTQAKVYDMTNETKRAWLESVWMYKDTLGQWKPFLTERHRQDTIDSGGWEVREFFSHASPVDAAAERDAPDPTLLKFYQVDDYPALVAEMEGHILKLIDTHKRNVKPWEDTFPPTLLPKWIRKQEQRALVLADSWQDEAAESWGESREHATLQRCADELRAALTAQQQESGS